MCTRSHTDFLNCSSITFPTLGFLWRNITNFFKFCSHSHNRVDVIAQTQTTVIYTPVAEWKQIKTTQHPISRALLWLIYPSWENEECIVDPMHCAQYWSCNSSQNGHNYYCWKSLSREPQSFHYLLQTKESHSSTGAQELFNKGSFIYSTAVYVLYMVRLVYYCCVWALYG